MFMYSDDENITNICCDNQPAEAKPEPESLPECMQEINNLKERLVFLTAEFDNYRKRTEKEKLHWIELAQTKVLVEFLPILDDLERAFAQISPEKAEEYSSWLQGFDLIRKSFQKLLQKHNVKEMDATGLFDPERHEAIMQVVSSEHKPGEIVSVFQKGYVRNSTVLRPAQVSVAQEPTTS